MVDADWDLSCDLTSYALDQHVQTYLKNLGLTNTKMLSRASALETEEHLKGSNPNLQDIILVINKCDLLSMDHLKKLEQLHMHHKDFPVCVVSCITGQGLDTFLQILLLQVKKL